MAVQLSWVRQWPNQQQANHRSNQQQQQQGASSSCSRNPRHGRTGFSQPTPVTLSGDTQEPAQVQMGQGWSQAGMVAGGGRPIGAMTGQRGRGGGVRGRRGRWVPGVFCNAVWRPEPGSQEDEPVGEPEPGMEANADEMEANSEMPEWEDVQDPGLSEDEEPEDEPEQPVRKRQRK